MAKEFKKYVIRDSSLLTLTNELFIGKNKTIKYDRTGGNYFYFAYQQYSLSN